MSGTGEAPKVPKTPAEKDSAQRLIVVLERASLETVKAGKSYELLNCDDHAHILKKHKRDPAEVRPDITHQMLLTLLDSPLNKSGKLQVYIHTENNILIEVSPHIRIPRTYKRFAGLMVQLLHKLKIRAVTGPDTLLKVVKNPVDQYLPTGARKIGTSKTGKLVNVNEWVTTLPEGKPVVFVLGALAHGKVEVDYTEECISVSEFPLSGSVAAGKVCCAFEQLWGILEAAYVRSHQESRGPAIKGARQRSFRDPSPRKAQEK
eukprot:CAMPEP_0177707780 /NCGR_PEP_ID=MMETSP0484_2-20121128/9932_1 /TAXON_ID=354590 /ORGANISM="Rhodomonas lens, Strain RHODO" /LENGTH=261 /DNA_ID=CAMNT_0019219313 /DNA_START=11 /DNA_END=794 /DNA_ORIENTATION=-